MNNLAVLHRPQTLVVTAPQRLAVFGWSPEARDGLQALVATGAYDASAIADPSAMALIEARKETALTCHQQAWTFLQHGAYDALLIGRADSGDAIRIAAARGAAAIIAVDVADTSTLTALSDVARDAKGRAQGCEVFVLQPMLQEAGFQQLAHLLTDDEPMPRYLSVTTEAAEDPARLLELAVAQYVALAGSQGVTVSAEAWGTPARAIDITIDSANCHARIAIRHAPTPFARIAGETDTTAFAWRSTDQGAVLTYTCADGSLRTYEPVPVDPWRAEAQRIVAQRHDDHERIARQAALLDAVGRALVTGEAQQTGCCRRSEHTAPTSGSTVRPSHLRLVVP